MFIVRIVKRQCPFVLLALKFCRVAHDLLNVFFSTGSAGLGKAVWPFFISYGLHVIKYACPWLKV